MPHSKLLLTAGALPYDDGSGDQVTAKIEHTDEGVMLQIDMIHQIKIDDWSVVRDVITELVQSAYRMIAKSPERPRG